SAVRSCTAEKTGLVGRAHRGGEESRRGQDLGERYLGWHPARVDEARLHAVRQRQSARRGVELPRSDPAAPRAALFAATGSGGEVSDPRRREGVLAPADALQVGAAEGGEGGDAQEVSADPDERPAGRVRGRGRG